MTAVIACVDVDYRPAPTPAAGEIAMAACVLCRDLRDASPCDEWVERVTDVAPYEPGQFYKRELPCLLRVLDRVRDRLAAVVVDGYVWLAGEERPGLGAHLYRALDGAVPVIGVAKQPFAGATLALPVVRGESARPLYVTAVGFDPATAAAQVRAMHGEHRFPTLLKRVDTLCRRA